MGIRNRARAFFGLAALLLSSATATGGEGPPISWKKTVIEGRFRSEGVAVADVNKDGKPDILVGDFWYEAPTWARHEIRKPGEYGDGLHGYSDCMACWADDVDGDGWPDQVVVGFPGKAAHWYENPQGKPGRWAEHEICPSACNETPLYVDLFGEGRRVLVVGAQEKGKNDRGRMAWFAPGPDKAGPWEMHAISEAGAPGTQPFSHGLGAGDLNGDGRKDVICTAGWWEQPSSGREARDPWVFHPASLGDAVADMVGYDLNADGKADVVASSAHKSGIWWFEQSGRNRGGHPLFARRDLFPDLISETHAMVAADINGDGLVDLVTGKRFWSHGRSEPGSDQPPRIYWLEAARGPDGKITFTPREVDDASGIGTQFTVLDTNGDGLPDIVTANKKGVFLLEQARTGK